MNRRGVSTIVGFILILMIGTIIFSVLQTKLVPELLKDAEMKHMNEITNDMLEFDSSLVLSKLTTIEFDLGVDYPKYPLLLIPQPIASTISCDRFYTDVHYVEAYPENGYEFRLSDIGINSNVRINVTLRYIANPDYELIFENTAVFKKVDGSDRYLVVSDQKMFLGDVINVYILNTSFKSVSTTSDIDLVVVPISYGGDVVAKNVTIVFDSVYPEYWVETLGALGYDVRNENGRVIVNVSDVKLRFYYLFLTKGLSISPKESYEIYRSLREMMIEPKDIVKVTYQNVDSVVVGTGQSAVLGVKVLDQFRNPVSGERVVVSVDPGGAVVNPSETYTDLEGNAYATFQSNIAGDYRVSFTCPDHPELGAVVYNVSVRAVGGGGGGNIAVSLSCPEGWDTDGYAQKTVRAYVTGDGQPLPGYEVVFAVNSSDVVLGSTSVKTDINGYAETTITQLKTGKNWYRVYAYAGSAFDYHDILLNTTVPPNVHVLVVYIENLLNVPLDNYPVRITIDDPTILNQMNADGSDLRVAESLIDPYNQTEGKLPYWIETPPSSGVLSFWVKVNLSANENKTIFVYWSGRDVASESNGLSVFDWFDDFNGAHALSDYVIEDVGNQETPSYWEISGGVLYQHSNIYYRFPPGNPSNPPNYNIGSVIKTPVSLNNFEVRIKVRPVDNDAGGIVFNYVSSNEHYAFAFSNDFWFEYNTPSSIRAIYKQIDDTSHVYLDYDNVEVSQTSITEFVLRKYNGQIEVYQNGALILSASDNDYTTGYIGLFTNALYEGEFHAPFIIRKYVEPEPKVTIGEQIY